MQGLLILGMTLCLPSGLTKKLVCSRNLNELFLYIFLAVLLKFVQFETLAHVHHTFSNPQSQGIQNGDRMTFFLQICSKPQMCDWRGLKYLVYLFSKFNFVGQADK
jgi:hypothetical protein